MGGDQPLNVGESATITCMTTLAISSIEWIDDMGTLIIMDSENQLDLVFNPVIDSMHNREYTCRITASDSPLEIDEKVTVRVVGKQLSCPFNVSTF